MLQPKIMNLSGKGAVVIPTSMRKQFGFEPKGKVMVIPKKDKKAIEIIPVEKDPIKALSGFLVGKTKSKSLVKELLEERKRDLEIDEHQYRRYAKKGV